MSTTNTQKPARRGEELVLDIEKFADRGRGLARHESGLVVFVPQAVPGDRVRAKVYKRRSSFAEAKLIELLESSEKRTEPRCFYFGTCGGCDWQHVEYAEQARMKAQSVREALVHEGGFDEDTLGERMRPIIEAERSYFYRNRMGFDFSTDRWLTPDEIATGEDFDMNFALGLHVPQSYFKVLDLEECHLQSPLSQQIVNRVRAFARERRWKPWDIRAREGYLRHLVVRQSEATGDVLVNLVTSRREADRAEALRAFFEDELPEVTTLVNTVNDTPSQTAERGGDPHVLLGNGILRERLSDLTFEIGPDTFFQTNTLQAERLFAAARELADLKADDRLYDLYCGAGALSLFVADAVKEVVGVELVEGAVEAARTNAEANGVENARFVSGALRDRLTPTFAEKHGAPDVLLADPPRAGMHEKVVRRIAELRPERFVYVSCNPQTQARDLKRLRAQTGDAYRITAVQPVDMFPQTAHVENIVALRLEES